MASGILVYTCGVVTESHLAKALAREVHKLIDNSCENEERTFLYNDIRHCYLINKGLNFAGNNTMVLASKTVPGIIRNILMTSSFHLSLKT